MNDIIDFTESLSSQNSLQQAQTNVAAMCEDLFVRRQSDYRAGIQKHFLSYAGHYGALFPEDAAYIFPGMQTAIGIDFLAFIRMMVMSCEGWNEIKKEFIVLPESCKTRPMYKKCCLRCGCKPFCSKQNAYKGMLHSLIHSQILYNIVHSKTNYKLQ